MFEVLRFLVNATPTVYKASISDKVVRDISNICYNLLYNTKLELSESYRKRLAKRKKLIARLALKQGGNLKRPIVRAGTVFLQLILEWQNNTN